MAHFSALRILTTSNPRKMARGYSIRAAALATTMLATAAPSLAADVTPDRLVSPAT